MIDCLVRSSFGERRHSHSRRFIRKAHWSSMHAPIQIRNSHLCIWEIGNESTQGEKWRMSTFQVRCCWSFVKLNPETKCHGEYQSRVYSSLSSGERSPSRSIFIPRSIQLRRAERYAYQGSTMQQLNEKHIFTDRWTDEQYYSYNFPRGYGENINYFSNSPKQRNGLISASRILPTSCCWSEGQSWTEIRHFCRFVQSANNNQSSAMLLLVARWKYSQLSLSIQCFSYFDLNDCTVYWRENIFITVGYAAALALYFLERLFFAAKLFTRVQRVVRTAYWKLFVNVHVLSCVYFKIFRKIYF